MKSLYDQAGLDAFDRLPWERKLGPAGRSHYYADIDLSLSSFRDIPGLLGCGVKTVENGDTFGDVLSIV
jgi:hypothetical protein